ncbi:hypothetical protein C8Q73DRAFT_702301 [Cubamyces lactineus]|nr:hypothetical protein C8Q73DRAFT_702301 [Cubamyces lactineus]
MPRKKQASPPSSRESSEDPQFVVEVIKAARVKNAAWEYLVKWANYDSDDDTWEPDEHLRDNCKRLLESFWDDIGLDDEDYHEGYVTYATPSWIKREKKLFARTLAGTQSSEDESSDDDEPSALNIKEEPSSSTAKGKAKSKGKGKAVAVPTTGRKRGHPPKILSSRPDQEPKNRVEDSDDAPLSNVQRKRKRRAKPTALSSDEDDLPLQKLSKPKPTQSASSAPSTSSTTKAPAREQAEDDARSESGGSLFSERASSPEVALGASTSTGTMQGSKSTSIPMKRPSMDEGAPGHHRKRQVMEMPMPITGAVGNSTKARLAQRGQQPPPAASAPPASGVRPKLDLSTLSFKKKSAATAGTGGPSPVRTDSPTTPALPRRANDAVQTPMVVDPPPAAEPQPAPPLPRTNELRRTSIPLPRRSTLRAPPQQDPMAEADQFLSNIMPADMAGPMHEEPTPETPTTPSVPVASGKPKVPPLPRIGKKWKWTGQMFMDTSEERAERVCSIILHDPSEPLPNGLRFSICLRDDTVRFSAFHDLAFLPLLLDACTRVQQFARVGPAADDDAEALKQLGIYMLKRSLFCYAYLYMEETSVALLMLFPAGHPLATKFLMVPPGHAGEALLQAALVPWELTAKEFCQAHWKPRTSTLNPQLDPAFIPVLDAAGRKVVAQRRYHQALHILGFPKALYDFMSAPNHPYCIWNAPADETISGPGYETLLLKEILSTCASQELGYKADVRVVFVHVGALDKLHCLPGLAERRAKRADVRFVTYGTHPSVPSDRWGIRELYPMGGIVTFTPSAIIQGHYRIFNRISQIAEHPAWECYVLPSVVAMVAKLSCQGVHPLQVYDEGNFVYEDLLKAIADGSVALLQAPPLVRDPPAQQNPAVLWTRWMFRVSGLDARGILEECLERAAEQFAITADADLPAAIEKEIARDIVRMQVRPAIMDNYRRFVLFRTKQDAFFAEDSKFGIECTTYDKFDFRDGFFSSNDSEKKRG